MHVLKQNCNVYLSGAGAYTVPEDNGLVCSTGDHLGDVQVRSGQEAAGLDAGAVVVQGAGCLTREHG